MSRKLVVLVFVAALLAGTVSVANAVVNIDPRPKIRLIGDEEPAGKPGNGMVSIGDTIVVEVTLTPGNPDSVTSVVADMRKYGGGTAEMLSHFMGSPAVITADAWIPSCSVTGTASMVNPVLYHTDQAWLGGPADTVLVRTEHWEVCYDPGGPYWRVSGNVTGTLPTPAYTGTQYWARAGGDTFFTFTITAAAGVCCTNPAACTDCDHFEFETWAEVGPDSVWADTLVVSDADSFWIDNTPCNYMGHTDPSVLVTANMTNGYTDTLSSWAPANEAWVAYVDYDTHHSTYISPWTRLYPTEFEETIDYFFSFNTMNAGNGPIFGETDLILNPASAPLGLPADVVCLYVDMRKLAHENGNDDIMFLCFDAHLLGQAYADSGWWHIDSPYYGDVVCSMPDSNGVPFDSIFTYCFQILPDSTDCEADSALAMIWISDSGDTTVFGTPTNRLLAIDNQIPDMIVMSSPTDSVMPWDIGFVADMANAGSPSLLNPASVGNPIPDWLQVTVDLEGLFDLADVVNGGRAFANMQGVGYYTANTLTTPFGQDYAAAMHPLSPVWGTDSIDVLASPPSPYGPWDQDSVLTQVYIFDNAGNYFMVGQWDTTLAIDNELPWCDAACCIGGPHIWCELEEDVASYAGYADVGAPVGGIYGNSYDNRDRIVLHANLGNIWGASEITDVVLMDNPYCNDPVPLLYDNGLNGADPVMGDKNYTGQTRIQVAGSAAGVCTLDTDELTQEFVVLVTDNSGNAAYDTSCVQPKVDNEPPTMTADHVAIMFWDDPETFGVDGDMDGDGIVTVGDSIIFEWRAEDQVWDDTEIDSVQVLCSSIDPSYPDTTVSLYWNPSGGVYRNHWPDGPGMAYPIKGGTIDGDTLCADFKVWDNAGNTNGWQNFCSDLVLDNYAPMIACSEIQISITGADTMCAAIGDEVGFYYDGVDDDVVEIGVLPGDLTSATADTLWLTEGASWSGSFTVDAGTTDNPAFTFAVFARDEVGNTYNCTSNSICVDNMAPSLTCANAYLRLWDYVDNIPTPIVNCGDNLTAVYFDVDGDVVSVEADFSNYGASIGTAGVVNMVFGFDGGPAYKWGYRVDPVPDGVVDQGPGGLGTLVLMSAIDDAGNTTSVWLCPIWFNESVLPDPIATPADTTYACGADCVGVDTERPGPPNADAITFELLESSNGIANVGDRLRIIVNMGDPTAPGYDMQWNTASVEADISQYGTAYFANYIDLVDDDYSAGGEGDGKFSYFFFWTGASGQELVEGAPILPGGAQLAADDPGTRIRVRSKDDAGNYSTGWVYSDVLVAANGGQTFAGDPVAVDNLIPTIDPADISVSFTDLDDNGICDIGDSVKVSVDMTDAPGGGVAGVWAYLYDWGYPYKGMVALTAQSPVYEVEFEVVRNPGDFCDDGVLFEDEACPGGDLLADSQPHPEVEVVAKDESDNWSEYDNAERPGVPVATLLGIPVGPAHLWVTSWPFVYAWTTSGPLAYMIADTDDPDPVNPDFDDLNMSDIRAWRLVDGRIGLDFWYEKNPRNMDVQEFYVFPSDEGGNIDLETFLGGPISAGMVPTAGPLDGAYEWVSDASVSEELEYFGVMAVDNAGNMSDPNYTMTVGIYGDATYPTATVEAFRDENWEEGVPTDIGDHSVYFLGYLVEDEYWDVCYVEWWGRVADSNPFVPGPQPGEWQLLFNEGTYPAGVTLPTAPYRCEADVLPGIFSMEACTNLEIVAIPWDVAGNHQPVGEADPFMFTWDDFMPVVTMFTVDGVSSPQSLEAAGTVEVIVRAYDECPETGVLHYALYLDQIGGVNITDQFLDGQSLAPGEAFTYTWDLTNYPAGAAQLTIDVDDEGMSGTTSQDGPVVNVLDQSAPGGVLAAGTTPGTAYQEGAHWPSDWDFDFYFLVEWPQAIGTANYDVGEVSVDYMVQGSMADWTPIGTKTTVPTFNGPTSGAYWYPYNFAFDTSIFTETTMLDVRATVMDHIGNTQETIMTITINPIAPDMAMEIPEAIEACGNDHMVAAPFNIIATETITSGVDTKDVKVFYKWHSDPDLHSSWTTAVADLEPTPYTNETVWRALVSTWSPGTGEFDLLLGTTDVAGNNSWDLDDDGLIDPGAFGTAPAGMKMTVYVSSAAADVRLWTLNEFDATDLGTVLYVQCGTDVTVTSMIDNTCEVARVDYFLGGSALIANPTHVGTSTTGPGYEATFPVSGDICDLLKPGALQNGYVKVAVKVTLTDLWGRTRTYTDSLVVLDQGAASAFVTDPLNGECISGGVVLNADVFDADAVYDVTYEYRTADVLGDWTHIATTKPNCGDPWATGIDNMPIYWYTNLLADGPYDLRAVSRDANLMPDPGPPTIRVTVDNTVPDVVLTIDPTVESGGITWIGGWNGITLTADVDDGEGCGVECVVFGYKSVEQASFSSITHSDCYYPFAVLWDSCGEYPFCYYQSGDYLLQAETEDKAGNIGYDTVAVYIDHWAPEAWITTIEDAWGTLTTVTPDDPCCCYDVWGVITLSGMGEDLVPSGSVMNTARNSGLVKAQFQYREYDPETECGYLDLLQASEPEDGDWFDLGDPVDVGSGEFSRDWDTGALAKAYYLVRTIGIDLVGNRYDMGCFGYTPPAVCIHVTDMIPPAAVIAGADDVTGYVWAVVDDHDQNDVAFVRFEFMDEDGVAWTVIGEVDESISRGLYGVPWHYIQTRIPVGSYWVRAVAYDDDWDPIQRPNMYDQNPAKMLITIASDGVTMASTSEITSLTRWGNLEECEDITWKAVSVDKPVVIGVFDNDPEDHFNTPWANWRDGLIRGDDPAAWYDHFAIDEVDPWGTLTLIATHNDDGIVGAVTNKVNLYKASDREGTRGPVSQDGMTVDIPAGAFDDTDGLLIIQVPELIADPSIDDPIAIGDPVMMTFLDHGDCDHYRFENGVRGWICMDYDDADIPQGYDEEDLRIAWWSQDDQEWYFEDCGVDFALPTVDTEANKACVYVDQTGTYAVTATKPLRITTPVFDPRCACGEGVCYTSVWPSFCTIIEDLRYDYIDEIKVVLDGPAGNPIYDDMTIYDAGGGEYEGSGWFSEVTYGAGWYGSYEPTSNRLCLKLVQPDSWSYYWDYWDEDWFFFYGDIISGGLPAGTYTLDITAQNEMGDTEYLTYTFMVDATAPDVDFIGEYVMKDPVFTLTVTDDESGVETGSIFLDIYGVTPDDDFCCDYDTEHEDYLGTATPTALEFDPVTGGYTVTFGKMAYGGTLRDGMSIDVVVYDGTYTSSNCEYGECRQYHTDDGVVDCAENHANPMWRRFTVDATPPTMEIVSDEGASVIKIEICDTGAGIDSDKLLVDNVPLSQTDYDWSWTPMSPTCGILRIDIGEGAVDINITATDGAGNFQVVEITTSADVVDLFNIKSYPNPFDPAAGENANIVYTLSKPAHVTISIYDFAGGHVKTIVDMYRGAGTYTDMWMGVDGGGNPVASGAYIAYIKVEDSYKTVTRNLKIGVVRGGN
ncbi:MAG: FlgD immunoglobulin-like domain containing protein [Candidatus Eisenbacteria bacterium]